MSNRGKKTEDDDQSELTSKRRLAFLDALLEAYENDEISREGVREEVDTFMFEVQSYHFQKSIFMNFIYLRDEGTIA